MEDFSRYNAEGTQLRKVQLRLLDILIEVDKVCRKHDIEYWIDYGTLIGAVRHGGFIPWDDDIDISLMHKDYARLRKVLIEELPEQFFFQDTTTDPKAFSHYGRIRDKKSYCYYPYFTKLTEQGLWIDIFQYDEIPSLRMKRAVDFLYRRTYREIHHYGDAAYNQTWRRIVNKFFAYLLHPISLIGVTLTRWLGKYNTKGELSKFEGPQRVDYKKYIFPLTEISFEGYMFMAPGNYDAHLRNIYGDYMQIPQEEKREQILDMNKVQFYD